MTTNPLERYILREGLTRRQFADLSGLDYSYVCRLVKGNRGSRIGSATAEAIAKATRNAVPTRAWKARP
jgi:transcriptional regulator with XRE-family HTH domain